MGNHAKHSTADLASGDHLCILYETEEERNSALAEYFRCGLDRNEKILYVTDHHDGRRISSCLNESGLDIEGALIKGQIKIIDIGTTKCPDEILELMRSEAKGPLEEDCSVLRIAVEMISSDCIKAAEYEAKIADFIRRIGCLTLCLYNQPRFDPSTIMDVLRAHPLVMVGAEVCKNLYYIPPGDQGRDSDSAMVLHAKESLLEHRHAEVRAQESEKKLREIIERSIDAVVMTDRQGRITYVSPSFHEMTGFGLEEMRDKFLYELITKSGRNQAKDSLNSLLLGTDNSLKGIQNGLIRKDGSEIFTEADISAVLRDGNIVGIHCVLRDITQKKKIEEALQESERKFYGIVEQSSDAIILVNEQGLIIEWNRGAEKIFGLSRSEVLGRPAWDVQFEMASEDKMTEELRTALKEGILRAMSTGKGSWVNQPQEIEIRRPDGARRIIQEVGFPIKTDKGFMVGSISRDITKDNEAREELRQSEEKYRAIIENIRDIIYTNSPDGKVTFVSPNISIAGYCPDEVLGHDLAEFIYPEDRGRVLGDLERALNTGESFPTVFRLLKKDGGYIHVEEMGKPVIKDGRVVQITGSVRDITEQQKAEEALLQSEKKYRHLVDNLNEGIWAIDAQANTTFVNNRMAEMLGYSVEEMLGRSIFSFMDDAGAKIANHSIECRRQGIREKHGFEFISKNGTRVYTWLETTPIIDDSGRYTGALAAVVDITESKLDEERLSLSESRYRMLFENSPMGIISVDTSGNILEANPVLLELLGSPSLEATCAINVLTYPPLIRAGFADHFSRCMESGQVLTCESLYTSKWGKCSYFKLKLTPIRDRLGRVTGAQATVEDVSEHKRAEKALFENLQFLQRLIDTIPNPVYYQNLSSVLLGCNKAFEKMFSLTKEHIIGRSIYDLDLSGGLASKFGEANLYLPSDPGVRSFESSSVMADGQTHHVINYRATYTNASGNVAGTVGTILDITERKKIEDERAQLIEELESRNAEMERFVYTVSHDLRSPLVTISGFVGLLKTDIEKCNLDRVFMDLKMIDDATYRMDKLLMDTLELSRIGRVASPEEAISMDEILEEALSQTRGKISAKGVLISKEDCLPRVYVDRMRIVEAVVNLIENSLKYMGDQVRPEIQLGSRIKDGETVFFVRDNGMGIEKSQHEKVFELFYKVDRKSDGTGAGLAIVKRIIEVHGGRIWIESERDIGCTVCFTLPVVNDPCALSN